MFRRKAEFIFAIGFQTVFCGTYFCDWLIETVFRGSNFLRFRDKIAKASSAIIYSATIYDARKFCPKVVKLQNTSRKVVVFVRGVNLPKIPSLYVE